MAAPDVGVPGMPAPEPPPGPDAQFASEARASGLVLPRPARPNLWLSVVVIVVVLVAAMGIGFATGWTDLRGSSGGGIPALYGPQNCGATAIRLNASFDPSLDSGFQAWVSSNAHRIVNTTGGCIDLAFQASPTSGNGSGLGARSVQFVVTPSPAAPGTGGYPSPVVFFPTAVGALAVVYNLPGIPGGLRLNASVLAGLFSGTITAWNSSAIQQLNPALDLQGLPDVHVTYRADATNANAVLATYLAGGDPSWAGTYGVGSRVAWPVGTPVSGEPAMAGAISGTPGSLGYVELTNASLGNLSAADLENPAGQFVGPTPASVTGAANSAGDLPTVGGRNWSGVSLVNTPGADSYPLASVAYVGLYADIGVAYGGAVSLTNATWLMTLLWWIFESTAYVPLPAAFTAPAQSILTNVTYDGTAILQVQDSENGENGGETGEF